MSEVSSEGGHSIEYVDIGTWQAGSLLLARCECGWQSQRTGESVVKEEVRRHLSAVGTDDER